MTSDDAVREKKFLGTVGGEKTQNILSKTNREKEPTGWRDIALRKKSLTMNAKKQTSKGKTGPLKNLKGQQGRR